MYNGKLNIDDQERNLVFLSIDNNVGADFPTKATLSAFFSTINLHLAVNTPKVSTVRRQLARTCYLVHTDQQERPQSMPQHVLQEPLFAEGQVTISQKPPEKINPSEGAVQRQGVPMGKIPAASFY